MNTCRRPKRAMASAAGTVAIATPITLLVTGTVASRASGASIAPMIPASTTMVTWPNEPRNWAIPRVITFLKAASFGGGFALDYSSWPKRQ